MSDMKFLNGILVKAPRDGAPDFVKGSILIKREELLTSLSSETDEWINLDIKESKKGTWYCAINDWKPPVKGNPEQPTQSSGGDFQPDSDLPF